TELCRYMADRPIGEVTPPLLWILRRRSWDLQHARQVWLFHGERVGQELPGPLRWGDEGRPAGWQQRGKADSGQRPGALPGARALSSRQAGKVFDRVLLSGSCRLPGDACSARRSRGFRGRSHRVVPDVSEADAVLHPLVSVAEPRPAQAAPGPAVEELKSAHVWSEPGVRPGGN